MLKNIFKSALIGAAMLAVGATAASAATYEINIYGASAQYKYWTAAAPEFLKKANGLNCATVYTAGISNSGIAICPGTPGINTAGGILTGTGANGDNNTYIIRYSALASIDGIKAVQDIQMDAPIDCPGESGKRKMADPALSTFTLYTSSPSTGGAVKSCTDVTVGVSDVEPATFNQESHGYQNYNSTTYIDRYALGVTMGAGYTHKTNLVIPFGFIKNPAVVPTNMTRSMAGLIFGGQIFDWSDLGYAAGVIDICMRHAGSGTHATLDAAVFRADYNINSSGEPDTGDVWFNESSGSAGTTPSGMAGCVKTKTNAVGYADADINTGSGSIVLMTYQGAAANKANVVSGLYDFWSYQHGYYKSSEAIATLEDQLFEWSKLAVNMPVSLGTFWAAEAEMNVYKANDFGMPQKKAD